MYNQFSYISSEVIITQVKQELKSYFDSGAVDDILFPQYIDDCLRKFGTLAMVDKQGIVEIESFKGHMPPDFYRLKVALLCDSNVQTLADVGMPTTSTTFTVENCQNDCMYCPEACYTFEKTTVYTPLYMVTLTSPRVLRVYYGSKDFCVDNCQNITSTIQEELKIDRKTAVANFSEGWVYIEYKAYQKDEFGPLIPEVIQVEQYISSYLKYKVFEQLFHSVADETQNQIFQKMQYYNQEQMRKYEAANTWLKLWTKQQTKDSVQRQRDRNKKFNIY